MDLLKPFRLLGGMLYPEVCACCGNWLVPGEESICLHCLDKLPRTGFYLHPNNPVERIFHARIPVSFASSYLHFTQHGMVQGLLHELKYQGNKKLAIHLGRLFASDLLRYTPDFHPGLLVPVPLHPRKEKQRGYNQAHQIAIGLGEVLGVPVSKDFLKRNHYTQSQTRKGRYSRWENVGEIFSVSENAARDISSIVLVDDVLTTGATAEACLQPIVRSGIYTPGYLSLAFASG